MLFRSQSIPQKQAKKPRKAPKKISAAYLENAALYYLQRYATSTANFRRVLRRKIDRSCRHHGEDPGKHYPLVEDLVRRYAAVGLLDDAAFARARVSSLRRQGRSRKAILAKLAARGLGPGEVEEALAEADEGGEAEFEAACRLARRKKIGPWRTSPLADPKDRQKEMAALARAGFSYDIARRALEHEGEEEF